MADERISIDVSQALGELAKLNKGLLDVQGTAKKAGDSIDNSFDEGFALGMVDALNNLQEEYLQLKNAANVLKSALKGATDPTLIERYTQSIGQLEAGMKKLETAGKAAGVELKKVKDPVDKTGESFKRAGKEVSTGKQVFEGFFGALTKATIILAVIEGVVKLTKYAVGLAESTKLASKQFEAFTGSAEKANEIVGTLQSVANKNFLPVDDVLQAGKALLAFGENSDNLPAVLGRIADVSAATGKNFNELTTIYGKARTSGVLYAEDINQLVDAGIPIIQEFAKQMGVGADEVKKLASEGKISFEELQLAMFNLTAEGGKFAGAAQAQSETLSGAWTKAVAVVQPALQAIGSAVSEVLQGALEGFTLVANALKNLFSDAPVNTAVKDQAEADKDAMYADRREYEANLMEKERLEKEAAKRRAELANKSAKSAKDRAKELANIEREKANLTIAAMKDGQAKEIAQENLKYEELIKQLKKYHIDTTEATEQHNLNIQEIELKYTLERISEQQKLIDLRKAQAEFEAEQAKGNYEKQKKNLEDVKAIRESEIDITEAEFANLIKVLEDGGAKKEDIAKLQFEFDQKIQAERLQAALTFQRGLLAATAQGDTAQITLIKNNIALLEEQLSGIGTGFGGDKPKEPKGILDLLGIDLGLSDSQMNELKQGLGNLKSIFDDIAGAQLDQAEAAIEAAEKNIEAAQTAVDEQKRLNEEGFANNLSDAERNLAAAKEQEQKAIEQKKAAQKQQNLIDTASQVSSLITASAKTLQTFNGPLLPIGIALIAAMFGAFFAAKARAAQAAKFKHGGEGRVDGNSIIVGASHDAGGVGIEAEGGEFFGSDGRRFGIVNKRMTAKHFDLLTAVNKDDRGKMRQALERLTGPQMRTDAINSAIGAGSGSVVVLNGGDKKTHSLLADIKDKSTKTITVEGNYVVEREGNYTRRRRIRA